MASDLRSIYDELYSYCEREGFAGFDPFDGLNSWLFHASPLKYSRSARLAFTQVVKRCPIDLRPVLLVEKGVNPKALALFALGELSRFRAEGEKRHADSSRILLRRLLEHKIESVTPADEQTLAFGYNFDWQSRVFYAPRGTPAIVPTAFAQQALFEAYGLFGDEEYLEASSKIARFVVSDLNRPFDTKDEVCFSYTPGDNSIVYNASLLAAECVARVAAVTGRDEYFDLAMRAARFVIDRQRADGAWAYGAGQTQTWIDNFHTSYILVSLYRLMRELPGRRHDIAASVETGLRYWLDHFFLDDGAPKYYERNTYPIDIHSAASAITGLCELRHISERALPMAARVADWTVANMRDPRGYFYYQKRKYLTLKTPFMRWGQAWMAYALARLIEAEKDGN